MGKWKSASLAIFALLIGFSGSAGAQSSDSAATTSPATPAEEIIAEQRFFSLHAVIKTLPRDKALELLGVVLAKTAARTSEKEELLKLASSARAHATLLERKDSDELLTLAQTLEERAWKIRNNHLKLLEGLLMERLKPVPPSKEKEA